MKWIALAIVLTIPHHHHHHRAVWHAPKWWLPQAVCIHNHEGAWNSDTGNGYGGGMQFLVSTWNSRDKKTGRYVAVGGEVPYVRSTGDIARLPPRIQLHAAMRIWLHDHRSWHEWGTAGYCGLL